MDKKLLVILACPVCKGKLLYKENESLLVCRSDRLAYPIKDGIPVMMEPEAKRLTSEEVEELCSNT